MLDSPVPVPLPPKLALEYRDDLIDRLQGGETADQIIDKELQRVLGWKNEPDPVLARHYRLLATVHDEAELRALVRRQFLSIVKAYTTPLVDEDTITGSGGPLVAFAIGVAAGIAATWIYDEFIEGDETYTTEIIDSDGTTWTIVTDEHGRVIKIIREGHSP